MSEVSAGVYSPPGITTWGGESSTSPFTQSACIIEKVLLGSRLNTQKMSVRLAIGAPLLILPAGLWLAWNGSVGATWQENWSRLPIGEDHNAGNTDDILHLSLAPPQIRPAYEAHHMTSPSTDLSLGIQPVSENLEKTILTDFPSTGNGQASIGFTEQKLPSHSHVPLYPYQLHRGMLPDILQSMRLRVSGFTRNP
ncbi:hypothetical protein KEM48_008631 [Puccinia striiformis f. sp. tritici PST-130]|nr:hypothetical protein KEM48_008631 [Puccinia striiformis f. sp. tritici PST-130]